jgi:hypothetical protein
MLLTNQEVLLLPVKQHGVIAQEALYSVNTAYMPSTATSFI